MVAVLAVACLTLQPVSSLIESAFADTGTGSVSINASGVPVVENFDTLADTGTANTTLPVGWYLTETGGGARDNEQYAADNGGSNTGDTYSYGATGATERAFGGLQSGTLIPVIGAKLTNNTGGPITSLSVTYTGEEWRLGTAARTDRIDFQYSTDATDLSTGTYTDVDALDFTTPNTATTGAKDGNDAANRTTISANITGLSIAAGATFFIRWTSFDASGADDGLAVDDFSITANGTGTSTPSLSINNVMRAEGNSGTTAFDFTVSLSSPAGAGGVAFDIATADGTATVADNDYVTRSLTAQTIPQGSSTYAFTVTVNGDTTTELNETFFVNVSNVSGATVADGQGTGTITNDDVTLTAIHTIQGSGTASTFNGSSVTTTGIVTATQSNGFFIQEPDAGIDADPNTSEGIFVFTSSAPPAAAAVGNRVQVTATVQEFIPSQDPNSPPLTELGFATVSLLSSGNALPAPISITATETTAPSETSNSLDTLEEYEGMRVSVASLTVVAPTDGFVSEPNATSTSNGLFYGVVTGVARPFREPGIAISDPIPTPGPANVPRFDENPERLRVDSDAQPGASAINVTAGAIVTNLVGPLDFGFRTYTILPDPPSVSPSPGVSGNTSAVPVPTPDADELTISSFNLERFFDTTNDPGVGDPVLTPTAFNNRLNKASLAVRNILRTPDVLGVIEFENLSTLQTFATKLNNDAVAAAQPNPNYQAYLEEGNDIGGIDVGFLVKSSRVTVINVTQEGKTVTYINPVDGQPETLNDRPPLVLLASATRPGGGAFDFTVIVNHLRSLIGAEENTDNGRRVRAKRRAQAEFLANLIQTRQSNNPSERIVAIGDFNAFQFNDGYVDSIGTIKGTPAPPDQVVLASSDLVNPDLHNAIEDVPVSERYTFSFDGNAQVLDHILVNDDFRQSLTRTFIAHVDADFPETFRNDPNRPERISDHDAPIAYFTLGDTLAAAGATLTNESCPAANNAVDPGERVTVSLGITNSGANSTSNLTATLQPSANVIAPSGPQTYGAVASGASASKAFSFTANGECGQTITLMLQLQDGSSNRGVVTFDLTLGCNTACATTRLVTTSVLARSGSDVVATVTVQNQGVVAASAVTLTQATLGAANGAPLPQTFGSIAPGASASFTVTFPNPGAAGDSLLLRLGGTYTGGTFSSTKRVTLP
ncbi:MAG: nuclease [Acidobacteriota bacterium]|nr:nuclease [Acidobacteriota bacterium]